MPLTNNWRPRIDNVDDADVSAVNQIAGAVIEAERNISATDLKSKSALESALDALAKANSLRADAEQGVFSQTAIIDKGENPTAANAMYQPNKAYKVIWSTDATVLFYEADFDLNIDNMILIYANITNPITINWGSNFIGDIPDVETGSYIFLLVYDVFHKKWRCAVANKGGVENA